MEFLIRALAFITRRFHPRGIERILRVLCNPDKTKGFETIISDYDGDLKFQVNPKYFTEWFIFFKGHYETNIVDLIRKHFPEGGYFVDVGANVGALSLIAAKKAGKVISVEPWSFIADRLKKNFKLNHLQDKLELHQCCASDKGGSSVSFYLPVGEKIHSGMGSLYKEHARGKEIKVKVKTLDSIIGKRKVDFIKIDTEGHDQSVIVGGARTIERCLPVIVYEDAPFEETSLGRNVSSSASFLQSLGYTIKRIDEVNVLCLPPNEN